MLCHRPISSHVMNKEVSKTGGALKFELCGNVGWLPKLTSLKMIDGVKNANQSSLLRMING